MPFFHSYFSPSVTICGFPADFGKPKYGNPKESNYVTELKDWLGFIAFILRILKV